MTQIDFNKMQGLAPAIVQDADNGDVLMVGFMNQAAFEKTLALDEDNARAFLGLSTAYRRLGDNQQTVDCALRAVSHSS